MSAPPPVDEVRWRIRACEVDPRRRVAACECTPGAPPGRNRGRRPQAGPSSAAAAVHSLPRPAAARGPRCGSLEPWTSDGCACAPAARRRCGLAGGRAAAGASPAAAAAAGSRLAAGRCDPRPAVAARFDAPAGPYAPGHRGVDLLAPAGRPGARGRRPGRWPSRAGWPAAAWCRSTTRAGCARRTSRWPPGWPAATRSARGARAGPCSSRCRATARRRPACTGALRRGETYLDPLTLLGAVRVRLLPVWGSPGRRGRAGGAGRCGRAAGRRRPTTGAGDAGGDSRRPGQLGWRSARLPPRSARQASLLGRPASAARQSSDGQVGGEPAVVGGRVVGLGRDPDEAAAGPGGDRDLDGRRLADPVLQGVRGRDRVWPRPSGSGTSCMLTAGVPRQVGRRDAAAPWRPRAGRRRRARRCAGAAGPGRAARAPAAPAAPTARRWGPRCRCRRRPAGSRRPPPRRRPAGAAPGASARRRAGPPVPRGAQHHLCRLPTKKSAPSRSRSTASMPGACAPSTSTASPRSCSAGTSVTSGSRRAVGEVTWSRTTSRVRSCTAPSTAASTSSSSAASGTCTVSTRAPAVGGEPVGGDAHGAVAVVGEQHRVARLERERGQHRARAAGGVVHERQRALGRHRGTRRPRPGPRPGPPAARGGRTAPGCSPSGPARTAAPRAPGWAPRRTSRG